MRLLARVTDIDPLPGSKRGRRIWVDGALFRTTSRAAIRMLALDIGSEVDPERLTEDCLEAERRAAWERAIALLSYHDFSTSALASRLSDDGYPPQVVQETVARLVETGLVDDARYAESVARTRMRAGFGHRAVRRYLARAGVADDLVEEALRSADEDSPDIERIAERLARPRDDVDRLAARLVRRGFDVGDSYCAARAVLGDSADTAADAGDG
ncbi:MAG: RecX family transcriptional regulator [Coriobacteriia bacterium]|nr:RecX family transcriptional regulator [Coriobacteriia bacterium]